MLIREDLIQKELQKDIDAGCVFSYRSLSNRFLDKLYRKYYVVEMCEDFYDSIPPELEDEDSDELYSMYVDYMERTDRSFQELCNEMRGQEEEEPEEAEDAEAAEDLEAPERYDGSKYTLQELRQAYRKVKDIYKAYEPERVECLSWQEPYTAGTWNFGQQYIDRHAREVLQEIRREPVKKKGRLFVSSDEDTILIYWYARDIWHRDYWFLFQRKADRDGKGKR